MRALICAALEDDGFTNGFSSRLGGVSPMPENSLNLAGFNEDDAENIYENRRRFLKLFAGDWTLAGCWQVHGADIRVIHSQAEAQPKPGVLGDDEYCDALVSAKGLTFGHCGAAVGAVGTYTPAVVRGR